MHISDYLKDSIIIYIKIAPTCFGAVTPSSGIALFALAKVTAVKLANYGTSACDYFGGDVAAHCSRSLVCVYVAHTNVRVCSHITTELTFRHRASCILGQAFHCSPENTFLYI